MASMTRKQKAVFAVVWLAALAFLLLFVVAETRVWP